MKSFRQFISESKLISEGKHWPEDYVKTAKNIIKQSVLGQQSWYSDQYIDADLKTFANEFQPLSHKNSNLGFFSPLIKWFVEYSGSDKNKYQEFIEGKLDNIIRTLQQILNDKSYDSQREAIKKMSFKDFEKMMSDILAKDQADSDSKLANIQKKDDYELIPIYSYDEFHDKFGGNKTGYNGKSEWCHANGKETYDSNAWTSGGKNMFFVLAKKGWENIKPRKTKNAFNEYGVSLIAILVDVQTNDLKAETLRWNHIIDPSSTNSGSSVDHAFKDSWGDLSQLVGFNVKEANKRYCEDLKNKLENESKNANKTVEQILKSTDAIGGAKTIPEKLRNLITKIVVPDSVTSIGDYSFFNCESLKEITIPDSVTNIGDYSFFNCESLKEITIPDSVTNIGRFAFSCCASLQKITIPDSVTNIGKYAFHNCISLKEITIPNSITSISDSAFIDCKALTSISIPNSVTCIGNRAFIDCKALTSISIPDSVTSIRDWAFNNCKSIKEITIPDSVTYIGDYAFQYCESLKEITIPDSVTNIGKYAFNYCTLLHKITISNSVAHIGAAAFAECDSLKEITIPNSVTRISYQAFDNCKSLKQVIFSSNSPLLNHIKHRNYKYWGLNREQIFIKKV